MIYWATWCRPRELTVNEMLSDAIVQALMDADGVDASDLEAMLKGVAARRGANQSTAGRARDRVTANNECRAGQF